MEALDINALTVSITFFLVIISFAALYYLRRKRCETAKLPPGSFGWPIIGETFAVFAANRNGTPNSFIEERTQRYDNRIFKTSLLGDPVAIFCGATGNKFLFSNENKLVTSWWPRSLQKLLRACILTSVGDEAKRLRRLLMTSLNTEALQRYVGTMDSVTQLHMHKEWDGKERVEIYPLAKKYTFELACRLFVSVQDREQMSKLSRHFNIMLDGVVAIPLNIPGTRYYLAARSAGAIREELRLIIEGRRRLVDKAVTQDILSYLLMATDENGRFMTEEEIVNNILVLLFAGQNTSSCALTMLMKYLAEFPDVYDKVLKEQRGIAMSKGPGELLNWEDIQKMQYSWNVMAEVMRLAPPIIGTFREAITDFTYEGFTIPKKWKLYWSASVTHMNPDYFLDPEKFNPSRFDGDGSNPCTFVPFGGGPRICPGKEFARLQILVFLHNVVKRFKWELEFPDEKIKIDPIPVPTKGLPARLQPHKF
ncbi:hypothetical protein HHK36_017524 [Tetracentron sinense]|uniref:Cytochrome P450 n=1 Tax=Tetracentron sinense TaxID=13715 RepID=A0A835DCP5_TETSI|nr:hypothetical protein HHK36_017524 [Tetracentron sinense]